MTTLETVMPETALEAHRLAGVLRSRVSAETTVRAGEPMARHTTLRVGGAADAWVEPASETDLALTLRLAAASRLPVLMLGRGSNLLVRDGGIRGVVVHLSHPSFAQIHVEGTRLRCGAGARLKTVAVEARRHGLAGLEFLEGIPGSVGGALRMNAGAHGGEMAHAVEEVRLMDLTGHVRVLPGTQLQAGYRSCPVFRDHVALAAVLRGEPDHPAVIEQRMKAFNQRRWSTQPAAPSAGCIFKNPLALPAGRLVDELGLKGAREGGAMVSLEHGNFIVTDGHATAAEVLKLIERIRERARRERDIHLEIEVQVVGEELTA